MATETALDQIKNKLNELIRAHAHTVERIAVLEARDISTTQQRMELITRINQIDRDLINNTTLYGAGPNPSIALKAMLEKELDALYTGKN